MNHLIILPGNNPHNRAWGEVMLAHYGTYFESAYMQEYAHWVSGGNMNMAGEEQVLRAHLDSLKAGTEVFILAKSAGSILCLGAVHAGFLTPVQCVFFGMPFEWAVTEVFAGNWEAIDSFSVPAIAFHNEHDPTATYAYTERVIREHMPSVSLVTTPGSNHTYDDFVAYDAYLLPLFQS